MSGVASGNTVDRIVRHLADGIANSRYSPGQRLIEAELTRDLNVSRGPVREALRRLSAEGLVQLTPNRGALVRRLSYRQAMELFEIRMELECLAVGLAAAHMGDPCDRKSFEDAIAPVREDRPRHSTSEYMAENKGFHEAILAAGRNRELQHLCARLQLQLIMAQISGALRSTTVQASIAEHREIADAILAQDGERGCRAMRRHLARARDFMAEMPPSTFAPEA